VGSRGAVIRAGSNAFSHLPAPVQVRYQARVHLWGLNRAGRARIRSSHVTTPEAQMASHPNFDRAQAALDAARRGDYAPAFDAFADDVLVENGPGAGPWHRARGKDDLALLLLEFAASFGNLPPRRPMCLRQ
jgi:hypothetical protein